MVTITCRAKEYQRGERYERERRDVRANGIKLVPRAAADHHRQPRALTRNSQQIQERLLLGEFHGNRIKPLLNIKPKLTRVRRVRDHLELESIHGNIEAARLSAVERNRSNC